ncbi:hypothetical protein G4B88_013976 [Cannabis sativa]|uniref:Reverse transcriptase zinc-binding domain-containing protein n=1 Tax=Cannabis sativa TaxID=3483 RepID=A0A7J6I1P0_CANSA|nr:hypothetical protein G4B88_013976 [Cannabis sativa]
MYILEIIESLSQLAKNIRATLLYINTCHGFCFEFTIAMMSNSPSRENNISCMNIYGTSNKRSTSTTNVSYDEISNHSPRERLKILHFAWRGYHEILPTRNDFFRRNIASSTSCQLCGFGGESNAHVIFWCPVAQVVERDAFAKFIICSWAIWTEMNNITHGQQIRQPQYVVEWIIMFSASLLLVNYWFVIAGLLLFCIPDLCMFNWCCVGSCWEFKPPQIGIRAERFQVIKPGGIVEVLGRARQFVYHPRDHYN